MPMAHLCIHQFGCQVGVPLGWLEPNTPDYGAILMILVIKLSNFAWACHDGGKDPSALSEDQRRYAIRENPDILDFFGYIFFYGGFFIGPAFEFTDYQDYINRRAPFDTMPSPIFPALANFVLSLTTFGLFMYAKPFQMFDWAVTKDFRTYNFVLRWDLSCIV